MNYTLHKMPCSSFNTPAPKIHKIHCSNQIQNNLVQRCNLRKRRTARPHFRQPQSNSYEKRKLLILWEIHEHDATGRTKHHVFCTSTCNRSNVYINGAAIKLVCYTSGHIHPEQKSDMILAIHSDASCLYEPKALSQACANFLSTNKGIS